MTFGSFEQDGSAANGPEPIEWIVLERKGGKALLVTKYAIGCRPYNDKKTDTTWMSSSLRKWLNDDFLGGAFTLDESKQIKQTSVKTEDNAAYGTKGGRTTTDKIFLLSVDEAEKYFKSDAARVCGPSAATGAAGAYTNTANGGCWWWLRSPGSDAKRAARVDPDGKVNAAGSTVNGTGYAVRPAMWVSEEGLLSAPAADGTPKPTATPKPAAIPTPKPTATPPATPTPKPTAAPKTVGLAEAKKGDVVVFGAYEQDNNRANGKEKIEWIVLERDGSSLLLISRYGLDAQPYQKKKANVTWEKSDLRAWLNGTFLEAAFSADEKKQLETTTVRAKANGKYNTKAGNATQDKVFLLSLDEAEQYFPSDGERACSATEYAYSKGAYKGYNGLCRWWLRSPGSGQGNAARVNRDGDLSYDGSPVDSGYNAVRPVIWVNIG